ncbi:uncharacterized protein LOC126803604 [Argentina anserina]|uniref:uncharacterized protein LOC126803604 n=1 Tax=Argentina anserina TaxID=57926 RepID=UPI0021765C8B|nr:uncharacterized protein LOC126803604 [Potentilla anserina]
MCSSSTSCSYKNVHQNKKPFQIERRPTMLKDFLNENSNSCSSSGFKSFPRKPELNCKTSNPNPTTTVTSKLHRSRSKAASTTISAFQSFMNAVKNIQFTAVKTPSLLPRSLSRRLSKRSSWSRKQSLQTQVQISVKVKDILRWTSFRDEKLPQPLPWDFASSPHHCTTATTTTTTTTCSNSSNGSSWCDSDFTAEFLPSPGGGENEMGKKYSPCVGRGTMEATAGTARCSELDRKVEMLIGDEDEQHSPVSVLDFQFGEDDEETFSNTFDQSLANVERTKEMLMQRINYFESLADLDADFDSWLSPEEGIHFEREEEDHGIEERALELLHFIRATGLTPESCDDKMEDKLMLDFFREELGSAQRCNKSDDAFDWEIVSKAKAWIKVENTATFEWGLEHKNEAIVRDMHKGGKWINNFEDEQEELALEIETAVLEFLVDELSIDLLLR